MRTMSMKMKFSWQSNLIKPPFFAFAAHTLLPFGAICISFGESAACWCVCVCRLLLLSFSLSALGLPAISMRIFAGGFLFSFSLYSFSVFIKRVQSIFSTVYFVCESTEYWLTLYLTYSVSSELCAPSLLTLSRYVDSFVCCFFLSSRCLTHDWCRRHFNWLDEFIIIVILHNTQQQKVFAVFLGASVPNVMMLAELLTHTHTLVGVSSTFILIISMTIYRRCLFSSRQRSLSVCFFLSRFHCLWKPFLWWCSEVSSRTTIKMIEIEFQMQI